MTIPKVFSRHSNRSLEFAGRFALVGKSTVAIGIIRLHCNSTPRVRIPFTIAVANPCQLVSPPRATLTMPPRARSSSPGAPCAEYKVVAIASAITRAEVGAPTWSATMRSSSRSLARRMIVLRKLAPRAA